MWNIHQRRDRPTYVVEVWNQRLNSIVDKPYTAYSIDFVFKKEVESSDPKIVNMEPNLEGVKTEDKVCKNGQKDS